MPRWRRALVLTRPPPQFALLQPPPRGAKLHAVHPEALELARRRVAELDAEIAAEKRRLATLRARLTGGGSLARHAKRHGAVAALTFAALAVSAASWHLSTSSSPTAAPGPAPVAAPGPRASAAETRRGPAGASGARPPSARDTSSEPRSKPWEVEAAAPPAREPPRLHGAGEAVAYAGLAGSEGAPLMGAEQAGELAGRCTRTRPTMASLPRATRVMDFATCSGCDCCLPDGSYRFGSNDDRDPSAQALEECQACSITATLKGAGIRVERSYPQKPLRGRDGLVFAFDRPARMFVVHVGGMRSWGSLVGGENVPDPRVLTLIAKDARGHFIDAMRAEVDRSRFEHQDDEADFWPTLVVEACPGEAIAEVEYRAEGMQPELDHLAVLHADASGARGASDARGAP